MDQHGREGVFVAECTVLHDAGEGWRYRLVSQIYRRTEFIPESIELGVVNAPADMQRDAVLVIRSREQPVSVARSTFELKSHSEVATSAKWDEEGSSIENIPGGIVSRRIPVRIQLALPRISGAGSCVMVPDLPFAKGDLPRLRINWFVESSYLATPKRFFLGSLNDTDESKQSCIILERRDGSEFRIADLRCNCDAVMIKCSTKGLSAARHKLVVTVKPAGFSGFLYDDVIVIIDDPESSRVSIPVAASK